MVHFCSVEDCFYVAAASVLRIGKNEYRWICDRHLRHFKAGRVLKDVVKSVGTSVRTISLSHDLDVALEEAARDWDMTISEAARQAIAEWVAKPKSKDP